MEMRVSEIWIYPVKSLAGYQVDRALTQQAGFEFDRRWMLVDDNGNFITQREIPKMALVRVQVVDQHLEFSLRGSNYDSVRVPIDYKAGGLRMVTIWNDSIDAELSDPVAASWLSKQLDASCQLVKITPVAPRLTSPLYSKDGNNVSFADGYPYLILGQKSLDDLNKRLQSPIPMDRFRPNIVVEGSSAFQEDSWKKIRIGEIPFRVVKPCARCIIPTTDQQTALRSDEPIKTLATFRKKNSQIYFGQNAFADAEGWINIGDAVYIEEENDFH